MAKRRRPQLGYINIPPIDEIWMLRHCPDWDPAAAMYMFDPQTMRACEAEAFLDEDDVVDRQADIVQGYYDRLRSNYQDNKRPFSSPPETMNEEEREWLARVLWKTQALLRAGDPGQAFDEIVKFLSNFDGDFFPTLMLHEVPIYRLTPTDLTPV